MAFYAGQKVVYVGEPETDDLCYDPDMPTFVVGSIFTVRFFYFTPQGEACVELWEVNAPENDEFFAGFGAEAFRPIVENKTDISIFKKMLIPKRNKSLVAA